MPRKKVLFTSHTANFSKFNRPFMRWLKEQGFEVHYASAGEEEVMDCDKHFVVPFSRNPLKVSNIKALYQLRKILAQEKYDIIHTHTPVGSVITRLAAKSARKNGTRVIYTAHGFHFFKGAPLLNWLTYYPIEKLMAKYTDTLITINKEDYQIAKSKFTTDVRYIAGVGIDENKFNFSMTTKDKLVFRRSLGLKKDDFVILYLAELSKRKNQLWLISTLAKTIREYPHLHLLLAGQDSLNGKCQQLAIKLGIQDNVHFLGYRHDVAQLLKVSNLAVSSSLQEGLPLNVMEAMYCGLPIVVTACRGNSDLLENGVNGFIVARHETEQFAQRIIDIVDSPKLGATLSQNNRKNSQSYLLPDIINEMEKIYKEKRTVLHVLNSNKFSGAENVVTELIKEAENSYQAYYCSPSGDINTALEARGISHISLENLSHSELSRIIKQHKPAIIHAHDFRASILASFFHRSTPIISHIHQSPRWLNGMNLNSILYKLRANKFRKILVVSDTVKNSKLFSELSKDTVITRYNRVNKNDVLTKGGGNTKKTYDVGFCGRLENIKQPLEFIKFVKKLADKNNKTRAVMIGDGSLYNECVSLINELGIQHNIELVGFQANPYTYIKKCKFLVITSRAEGFGLVAIEAMLLGTVVLSYNLESIREIMGNDDAIGTNPNELATIYSKLKQSPNLYKALIDKNQRIADTFIQTSNSQESIELLYQNMERIK